MKHAVRRVAGLCWILALPACGGGGDGEVTEGQNTAPPPTSPAPPTTPTPAPPAPTPPAPTPPPNNSPPAANAGADQSTVEEQDVTIDGSATSDPNNDPLTYQWSLKSAPSGSGVKVDATTISFAFRPDLPGEYQLQLTASDASSSASDTVRVTADMLFTVKGKAEFSIDGASPAGSDQITLQLKTSGKHKGPPVAFTVTSNVPWLTVPPGGTFAASDKETPLLLRLNLEEVRRLLNGPHEGRVTITPSGGWTGTAADASLKLALPIVRIVAPYVAYVGEPSRVSLHGEHLLKAEGKSLLIGGAEALNIDAESDARATVDLPPLPAGTYTVRISHALDVSREMARVVVRSPPVYADFGGHDFGGSVQAFVHDPERDAIYLTILSKGEGVHFGGVIRNDGTGQWVRGGDLPTSYPNFEPLDLAISPDGTELWVTSLGCRVHRIALDTLALTETVQHACPTGADFTQIAPLVDGRVLIVQETGSPNADVLEYPGFTRTDILPGRRDPFIVQNGARDRLFYVEAGGFLGDGSGGTIDALVDVYDVGGAAKSVRFQEQPWNVSDSNLSMSGDGARTLHLTGLYDRDLKRLGDLVGVPWLRPATAVNARGTRAVALDEQSNALYVHDLTLPGSVFLPLDAPTFMPEDLNGASHLIVPLSGGAVFMVAMTAEAEQTLIKFWVRTLPQLTR